MAVGRIEVKVGAKGKAAAHSAYMDREDEYVPNPTARWGPTVDDVRARGSGNMPTWAANPREFWSAADKHERANGSAYREHLLTLPRELDSEQQLLLIERWIEQELGSRHAYQWALHEPDALDGGKNPHVHLMFSERQCGDGIARGEEQYFRRYNAKNPERGGCRKGYGESAGQTLTADERRSELSRLRDRWEQLANQHLAAAQVAARIDMRSLLSRGIDVVPEPKLGPRDIESPSALAELAEFRVERADVLRAHAAAKVAVTLMERKAQEASTPYEPTPTPTPKPEHKEEPEDEENESPAPMPMPVTMAQIGTWIADESEALRAIAQIQQQAIERIRRAADALRALERTWWVRAMVFVGLTPARLLAARAEVAAVNKIADERAVASLAGVLSLIVRADRIVPAPERASWPALRTLDATGSIQALVQQLREDPGLTIALAHDLGRRRERLAELEALQESQSDCDFANRGQTTSIPAPPSDRPQGLLPVIEAGPASASVEHWTAYLKGCEKRGQISPEELEHASEVLGQLPAGRVGREDLLRLVQADQADDQAPGM